MSKKQNIRDTIYEEETYENIYEKQYWFAATVGRWVIGFALFFVWGWTFFWLIEKKTNILVVFLVGMAEVAAMACLFMLLERYKRRWPWLAWIEIGLGSATIIAFVLWVATLIGRELGPSGSYDDF